MAVRRALAELHGPRMTAQNPRLEELSFMPREMLLKQRNFGARSMRQLDRICQHVGVSIGAEPQGFTLYPNHHFHPAFPRDWGGRLRPPVTTPGASGSSTRPYGGWEDFHRASCLVQARSASSRSYPTGRRKRRGRGFTVVYG